MSCNMATATILKNRSDHSSGGIVSVCCYSVPPNVGVYFSVIAKERLKKLAEARRKIDENFQTDAWTPGRLFEKNREIIKNRFSAVRVQSDELRILSKRKANASAPILETLCEKNLRPQISRLRSAEKALRRQYEVMEHPDDIVDEFSAALSPETTREQAETVLTEILDAYDLKSPRFKTRESFERRIQNYYNTSEIRLKERWLWCHATGQWLPECLFTTSSCILPGRIRSLDLARILGTGYGQDFMKLPRNSVCFMKYIGSKMNTGSILIVPSKTGHSVEYKLLVINKALLDLNPGMFCRTGAWSGDWNDIHGKSLRFVSNSYNRPSLASLWIRFAVSFLLASTSEKEAIKTAIKGIGPYWPLPITGKRGLIQKLAAKLGTKFSDLDDLSDRALTSEDDGEQDEDEQDLVAEIISQRLLH